MRHIVSPSVSIFKFTIEIWIGIRFRTHQRDITSLRTRDINFATSAWKMSFDIIIFNCWWILVSLQQNVKYFIHKNDNKKINKPFK